MPKYRVEIKRKGRDVRNLCGRVRRDERAVRREVRKGERRDVDSIMALDMWLVGRAREQQEEPYRSMMVIAGATRRDALAAAVTSEASRQGTSCVFHFEFPEERIVEIGRGIDPGIWSEIGCRVSRLGDVADIFSWNPLRSRSRVIAARFSYPSLVVPFAERYR